jgi:hypothetical protein
MYGSIIGGPTTFLSARRRRRRIAGRLAGLELALNRDKPSVGGVESSCKDGSDVEGDGWIAGKNRLVGDIELRLLRDSLRVRRQPLRRLRFPRTERRRRNWKDATPTPTPDTPPNLPPSLRAKASTADAA